MSYYEQQYKHQANSKLPINTSQSEWASSYNKQPPVAPSHYQFTTSLPTYAPSSTRTSLSHLPPTSSHSSHHTTLYAPLSHVPQPSSTSSHALSQPLTRASLAHSTSQRAHPISHRTLDTVLEKVKKTLNENTALRERAQRNFADLGSERMQRNYTDLGNERDSTHFERSPSPILPRDPSRNRVAAPHINHVNQPSATPYVNSPNKAPAETSDTVLRRLEANRKKYSELMQKLEDADTRLMVNKERYSEVKESLAGALKNLETENLQTSMRSSHSYDEYDDHRIHRTRSESPVQSHSPTYKRKSHREERASPPRYKSGYDKYDIPSPRQDSSAYSPREYEYDYRHSNPPSPRNHPNPRNSSNPPNRNSHNSHNSHNTYNSHNSHNRNPPNPRVYSRSPSPTEQYDSHYYHHRSASPVYENYPHRNNYLRRESPPPSPSHDYSRYSRDNYDSANNYASSKRHYDHDTTNNDERNYRNYRNRTEASIPERTQYERRPDYYNSSASSSSSSKQNFPQQHFPTHEHFSTHEHSAPSNNYAEDHFQSYLNPQHPTPRTTSIEPDNYDAKPSADETDKDERIRKLEEEMAMLRKTLELLKAGKLDANGTPLPRAPSLYSMKKENSTPAYHPKPAHEQRTESAQPTEKRNDAPKPRANFYDVPDDSSVDSEEEITFHEPPPVDTSYHAGSPHQMYKYGNYSRGPTSNYGNIDIETESGEAESTLASRTLEEKMQSLRM